VLTIVSYQFNPNIFSNPAVAVNSVDVSFFF